MSTFDRFQGCILGLACGDALGGPLEFMSAQEIKRTYGRVTEMIGGGWLDLAPGEYTDDTQMTLCVLESIIETGGVEPKDIAARFVSWYESRPKDVGTLTRSAIQNLAHGMEWTVAGRKAWEQSGRTSAGNGGLMRTAPVALFASNKLDSLPRHSRETCLITHFDERCQQSCVAISYAIATLARGDTPSVTDILASLGEAPHPEIEAVVGAVPDRFPEFSDGGYTVESLRVAWAAGARATSFEDGIVWVINLGGDTDTNGAVAGALLGARFGASAIPRRWLDALQNAEQLASLAARLWEIAESSAPSNKSTRKLP